MIAESIIIGVCIIIGGCVIGTGLGQIDETLKLILQRYAALENLGIFPPPLPDPPEPSQAIKED